MFRDAVNQAHVEFAVDMPEAPPAHERAAEAYTEAMTVLGNYIA